MQKLQGLTPLLDAVVAEARGGVIQVPRQLEGFPGTTHGGAVAALFHRLALPRPPVRLTLRLRGGVPTETPLALTTGSQGGTARLALTQGERLLAEATLARGEQGTPAEALATFSAWQADREPRGQVARTPSCVACGSANPLAAGVHLEFNDRLLWREWETPAAYRTRDGATHPALAAITLDELCWWLGALAQGEAGVTTEVILTHFGPIPPGGLLALGDRRAVTPDGVDPRGRYSRTRGYLLASDGQVLAAADATFAGSRAYTRRLLEPFLQATDRETVERCFPGVSAGRVPPAVSA